MSSTFIPIVIGISVTLVLIAVVLVFTSASSPQAPTNVSVLSSTRDTRDLPPNIKVTSTDTSHKIEDSFEKNSCIISVSNEDGTKEKIPIGGEWYQSQDNPLQCFAPVDQKCCEQVDLPSGEEGCMADFTGYTPSSINSWKNECLTVGSIIDMDKLGILSSHFSGDWVVEQKNGSPTNEDIVFNMSIQNTQPANLKINKNGSMFGMYIIEHITINPTKHLQASYTSGAGTKTDIIIENASDNTNANSVLRIVQSTPNAEQNHLTTYLLSKAE